MDIPLRPPVAVGDRVAVVAGILDDPAPMAAGMTGTVCWVGAWTTELTRQIAVQWDDGRRLVLLPGDQFRVVGRLTRRELFGSQDRVNAGAQAGGGP
jgi:hypothetical protein